jgi:hypothetical protein
MNLGDLVQNCFAYCTIKNMWQSLFSLLTSSHFTAVSFILARFSFFCDNFAMDRACMIVFHAEMKKSNKRRKLHPTLVIGRNDWGYNYDTEMRSFALALADYLALGLDEARDIVSLAAENHSTMKHDEELLLELLDRDHISSIFDAIYIIDLFHPTTENHTELHEDLLLVLEKFMKAAVVIIQMLNCACSSDNLYGLVRDRHEKISKISEALNRILLSYVSTSKLLKTDQEQFVLLVNEWITAFWFNYPFTDVHIIGSALDLDHLPSIFREAALLNWGIPRQALQGTHEYLERKYCSCSKYCTKLNQVFGISNVSSRSQYECICHISCYEFSQDACTASTAEEKFSNMNSLLLIEDLLPTGVRYVISYFSQSLPYVISHI